MPNLLDLIKNDSGLQELLANAGAMAKGAARGVTTTLPKVKDAITYTRQYESDVASFLNAIKLDAAK